LPSPKDVKVRCIQCRDYFFTTKQQAKNNRRFCNPTCKHAWQTGKPRSDRGSRAIILRCNFCPTAFPAGGRSPDGKRLPQKDRRFCSRSCSARAKLNTSGECKELLDSDIDWISKYFEGDGSAFVRFQGSSLLFVATIGNTDRLKLNKVAELTGVGTLVPRRTKVQKHRTVWNWRCFGRSAITFLKQIRPWLCINAPIADFLLQCWNEIARDRSLLYSRDWQSRVVRRSKELNGKGPAGVRARATSHDNSDLHLFNDPAQPLNLQYECKLVLGICDLIDSSFETRRPELSRLCPVCLRRLTRCSNSTQIGCSRGCAYRLRRRRGRRCRVLTGAQCRQLAGFLEAEGAISIARSSGTVHARVDIANTEADTIRAIQEATGVGSVCAMSRYGAKAAPGVNWRCTADAAHSFLEQLYPYLDTKRPQCELAMAVQERLGHVPSRCGDRRWQAEALEASIALNAKGTRPEALCLEIWCGLIEILDRGKGAEVLMHKFDRSGRQ